MTNDVVPQKIPVQTSQEEADVILKNVVIN